MSHNLTPAPLSPGVGAVGVQVPDAGDARTAASVTTPIQQLLNMISWLYNALQGGFALNVFINGTLTSTGAIASGAASSISSGLDVTAARSVNAAQDVNAASYVTAQNLTVGVGASVGQDLAVGRDASISRDAVIARNTSIGGLLTCSGGGSVTAPMHSSGTGRFVNRGALAPLTAGAVTLSLNAAQFWYFGSTVAGNQTVTITNAIEGDTIAVFNNGSHSISFSGAAHMPTLNGASLSCYVQAVYISGDWYPMVIGSVS